MRVADAAFDAAVAVGGEPGAIIEGLLLAAACYGRQHRMSADGLQRALGVALELVAVGLPDFRIEVVAPGDLEAELRKAGGT